MLVPLSPLPGINSDDTAFSAEGRWSDGNNVRFVNGKPQVLNGHSDIFTLALATYGKCRVIFPFTRSGATYIAYGCATPGTAVSLHVGAGAAAPTARTPAGLTNNETNWSLAPWGDTLLACPATGTLYDQAGAATAAAVAAAPDNITYMLVTPQRQVLALGCNEEISTTFNGLCIRGCDLEDYTDWTTTATNNAFEHILDGAGAIVAGRMIGAYVAVWTNESLFLGQFIGDPSQTYRFDKVDDGCGLAGPHAVVIVDSVAYWMGPDGSPRRWSPGVLPEIIPSQISRELQDNLDRTPNTLRYLCASHNPRFNEVRFDYADSRSGVGSPNQRYVALCIPNGVWHKGSGGRSAMIYSQLISGTATGLSYKPTVMAAYGLISGSDTICYEDVPTLSYNYDTTSGTAPYIQSAGFYLDESQRRVMIRRFIPDISNQVSDLTLTLTMQDRPQSTAVTKGPYTIATTDTKKDFRASGKIVTVKIACAATGSFFRLGKPLFDVVPLGER